MGNSSINPVYGSSEPPINIPNLDYLSLRGGEKRFAAATIYDNYAQGHIEPLNNIRRLNYLSLRSWEKRFRAAAMSDNYALFREHMKRLVLPDEPELMVEGTILVMKAIVLFANFDKLRVSNWLRNMQNYNPLQSPDARYAFTFDLCGKSFARVMVDSVQKPPLYLAGLFGCPWQDYKVVGYDCIWISRVDWSPLTKKKIRQLKKDVTNDLMFDYKEDEIRIWFEDYRYPGLLLVYVRDRDPGGSMEVEWESDPPKTTVIVESKPFVARGMRCVYGRGDHFGRRGHSFHLDIWKDRKERLFMRFWSRCSGVDGREYEIKGIDIESIPQHHVEHEFETSWIPKEVRNAYEEWIYEEL